MSALDPSTLDELRALAGEEALREAITLFVSGADKDLLALREAQQLNDVKALAHTAHTLRGSCAIIGARRMAALAAQLEDLARAEARDGVAELIDKLEVEHARTRTALEAETRGFPAGK